MGVENFSAQEEFLSLLYVKKAEESSKRGLQYQS
jgi:hypothetical protein